MSPIIEHNQTDIHRICQENNVKLLYFFGSVLNPEKFSHESDIDVLVSFKSDISMETYTDSYFGLLFALEELLGREVDLTTERSVKNPYFKEELEATKILFYDISEVNG